MAPPLCQNGTQCPPGFYCDKRELRCVDHPVCNSSDDCKQGTFCAANSQCLPICDSFYDTEKKACAPDMTCSNTGGDADCWNAVTNDTLKNKTHFYYSEDFNCDANHVCQPRS